MYRLSTTLLDFASNLIPTTLLHRWIKRDVINIFYHAVSDELLEHIHHLYPVVPTTEFIETLGTLQEKHNFVSYDQLQEHFLGGSPLPPDSVHLSFDDGFVECYNIVRPILLEKGIPCTFFLTIDWLDNQMLYFRHKISVLVSRIDKLEPERQEGVIQQTDQLLGLSLQNLDGFKRWITAFREPREDILTTVAFLLKVDLQTYLENTQPYLTRIQVQQMYQEGFTIGAHGLTHRKLGFIPKNEIENEIVNSCQSVREITGQDVVPFSFPQSAGNVDRGQIREIRDRHPIVGLLFDTKDLRKDAPFMINRIWAERPLTIERRLHPLTEILIHAYRDAWVEGTLNRFRR
jgi:peptidoglycan/xylan/chitin deacetylase (PgdA/CDA1 family)